MANRAVAEQRVTTIYQMLTTCHENSEILQFATKEWGISERQVHEYIARAKERLKVDGARHREEALDRQLSLYRSIIRKQSKDDGSTRLLLEALKAESQLLGLQAARKMPVLEAFEQLVSQGLATPAQLEAIKDGIVSITQKLRSATPADGAIASSDHSTD